MINKIAQGNALDFFLVEPAALVVATVETKCPPAACSVAQMWEGRFMHKPALRLYHRRQHFIAASQILQGGSINGGVRRLNDRVGSWPCTEFRKIPAGYRTISRPAPFSSGGNHARSSIAVQAGLVDVGDRSAPAVLDRAGP